MKLDPVALSRHREFGDDMAERHYRLYPDDRYPTEVVVDIMRDSMREPAADAGIGSRALEPYARAAAAGFLRAWRRLQRQAR
ncbi:hypothetical protein LRP31_06770 [Mesorhizobium mediterraneum]|uniref:Uncharacterized protein n=1 Tax=Mesorhizobium mediterraneum TaxID=43617 RepID=A0AB36R487_9HYPH|nr:hypothetical protein [Mesorhizobium mediterraneum]PAP99488.1 hypothetical protein CIT25_24125 [Mesorhizobium mediterraneum]RWN41650.1 MAG: hypothetical protein EOR96_12660 [Mesorhizobium sp.]WIW54933.1 hypothetical protein LRP31_06770 [Mesorhizobium mediterraneum]